MDILSGSDGADLTYSVFSVVGGHQYGTPSNPMGQGPRRQ